MNIKNMKKLEKHLIDLPAHKFDMREWVIDAVTRDDVPHYLVGSCGTVACVAGWALYLAHPKLASRSEALERETTQQIAARWLGLEKHVADDLFFGRWFAGSIKNITAQYAAQEIRSMIECET